MTTSHDDDDNHDAQIEPMDSELASLLHRGAPSLTAPRDAEARLLARLAVTIPNLDGGGGGGGGGAATATTTKIVLSLAAVAVAVAGAVVILNATNKNETQAVTTSTSPSISSSSSSSVREAAPAPELKAVSIDSLPSAPTATPRPATTPSATPPSSTASAAATNTNDEERRLVDGARGSLARGDAPAAMAALEEHERRFSSGVLAEERDALAVRTLVALHRSSDAETRATRFRSAHPSSLFLPSVEAAVSGAKDR